MLKLKQKNSKKFQYFNHSIYFSNYNIFFVLFQNRKIFHFIELLLKLRNETYFSSRSLNLLELINYYIYTY